jgi:hypothetical protein
MMNHLVVSQKLAIMRMMMMQQLTVMMAVVVVEVLMASGLIHGLGLDAGGRGTALQ